MVMGGGPMVVPLLFLALLAPVTIALMPMPPGVVAGVLQHKAGKAVAAVLSSPTLPPHCSLLPVTDGTTSPSLLDQTRLHASLGVVRFETVKEGPDANTTRAQLARVVAKAREVRVASWCVAVVVVSSDTHFLAALVQETRRGRLLVWATRLVVVTQLAWPLLQDLLQRHWSLAMMNALVLNREDTRHNPKWVVYQHLPYTPEGPRVVRAATWTPTRGLFTTSQLFPSKFNNFHGASFPVSVDEESMPLWGVVRERTKGGNTTLSFLGRDYLMLLAVARALNFTPAISLTTSVTQSIKDVVRGQALLLPLRLVLLPRFLTLVDYTFCIDRASLTFSLAKPPTKPQWQSLYYPLRPLVWAAILALILALLLLFILTSGISGSAGGVAGLTPVRVLLGQDLGLYFPRASSVRLLLVAWMLFAFVVGASYRGNLTAFLTVRKYPARPETLEQLALTHRPSTFPTGLMWFREYFTTSRQAATRTVGDLSSLVPTVKNGMDYMAANRGAFFYERYYMLLAIAEHYTRRGGDTDLYVAKENVLPNYAAWFIPHDAPFKAQLDLILARIIEAGLKDKWLEDVMRMTKMKIRARKEREGSDRDKGGEGGGEGGGDDVSSGGQRQPLTLTHLQGPFWLLVMGMVAALLVFLAEAVLGPWNRLATPLPCSHKH